MASGNRAESIPAFDAFLDLSREIGSDVLKTQGPAATPPSSATA
jgi:hypothetical protein